MMGNTLTRAARRRVIANDAFILDGPNGAILACTWTATRFFAFQPAEFEIRSIDNQPVAAGQRLGEYNLKTGEFRLYSDLHLVRNEDRKLEIVTRSRVDTDWRGTSEDLIDTGDSLTIENGLCQIDRNTLTLTSFG